MVQSYELVKILYALCLPLLSFSSMKLLVFDNHDSFTYNLVQIIREWGKCSYSVLTSEKLINIDIMDFDKMLVSPGPGLPSDNPRLMAAIKQASLKMPVLGVCLGHQAIAEAFGGKLVRAKSIYHGEDSLVVVEPCGSELFKGLPGRFSVGRYHSWVVDPRFPSVDLSVTARTEDGTIMALQHKKLPVFGVQFHPESIMTPLGAKLVRNWLEL